MKIIKNFLSETLMLKDPEPVLNKIEAFYNLLTDYNKKINLTAIRNEEEIIYKHFLDSLYGAKAVTEDDKTLLDIGTGAGFPGIVFAVLFDKKNITLIDSVKKKTDFLSFVKKELNLNNTEIINDRIENIKKKSFADVAAVRAVAGLSTIAEYSVPFLKVGGKLLAYKGKEADAEIDSAKNALKILNASVDSAEDYGFLCNGENYTRKIIIIKKLAETDPKYPRGQNKPRLKPL
jgi:16S rRNA (guanine527-N7)-methyltransferase